MTLSLNGWKGLSMGVFTLMSIVGAAVAVVMKERAKQLYVTCGVLFSAGVLLAGGFVHLISDSDDDFQELNITDFQWAFAIAGGTVAVLACLELALDRAFDDHIHKKKESQAKKQNLSEKTGIDTTDKEEIDEEKLQSAEKKGDDDHHYHGKDHDHEHFALDAESPFSSILLTIALSIHSIIEGLGIGSTQDVQEIQSAFIAVAFHKGFTAFALGNALVSSGYWSDCTKRKYFYLSIGTFVVVALLGIGIGWAISAAESGVASAVLVGITGGSFIFVAILEILPQEVQTVKMERLPILPVVFCFLLGYCLMSMLAIWA